MGIQKDYIGRASKYKYHILCNHWNGSILECSIGSVHILLILNVGRNAISFFNRDALDKFISHCNLDQVNGTQFPLSWRKVVIYFEDKNAHFKIKSGWGKHWMKFRNFETIFLNFCLCSYACLNKNLIRRWYVVRLIIRIWFIPYAAQSFVEEGCSSRIVDYEATVVTEVFVHNRFSSYYARYHISYVSIEDFVRMSPIIRRPSSGVQTNTEI